MKKCILAYCIIVSWTTHILPVWPFKSPEEKVCKSIMSSNFKEFQKKYPSLVASQNFTEQQKANMKELAGKRVEYWNTEYSYYCPLDIASVNFEKIYKGAIYTIGGVAAIVFLSNMADRVVSPEIIVLYKSALLATSCVSAKFVLRGIQKMYHGMDYKMYLKNKKSNAQQIQKYFEDKK